MQAEGYRRARRLLTSRGDYVAARVLGFVQSLLLVVLLVAIIAIFVTVLASRGEARFPSSAVGRLPQWVAVKATGEDPRQSVFKDTGVFPLIARSLLSDNFLDRLRVAGGSGGRLACCPACAATWARWPRFWVWGWRASS